METFLDLIREILRGIVRELSAYIFRRAVIENKKTTRAVGSKRVVLKKIINIDNHHPYGIAVAGSTILFFIIYPLYSNLFLTRREMCQGNNGTP